MDLHYRQNIRAWFMILSRFSQDCGPPSSLKNPPFGSGIPLTIPIISVLTSHCHWSRYSKIYPDRVVNICQSFTVQRCPFRMSKQMWPTQKHRWFHHLPPKVETLWKPSCFHGYGTKKKRWGPHSKRQPWGSRSWASSWHSWRSTQPWVDKKGFRYINVYKYNISGGIMGNWSWRWWWWWWNSASWYWYQTLDSPSGERTPVDLIGVRSWWTRMAPCKCSSGSWHWSEISWLISSRKNVKSDGKWWDMIFLGDWKDPESRQVWKQQVLASKSKQPSSLASPQSSLERRRFSCFLSRQKTMQWCANNGGPNVHGWFKRFNGCGCFRSSYWQVVSAWANQSYLIMLVEGTNAKNNLVSKVKDGQSV